MNEDAILWILPKWPLPVTDGARVATRALLRPVLAQHRVDLLSLAGTDEDCDPDALQQEFGAFRSISIQRRASLGKGALRHLKNAARMITRPALPVTISRYAEVHLQAEFARLLEETTYRAIVFDGLHGAGLSCRGGFFEKPDGPAIIYRAHNVETMIWQRAAQNARTEVERRTLLRQRKQMAHFETSLLQQADLVAPVSTEDIEEFRTFASDANLQHIPIGLDFAAHPPSFPSGAPLKLLYVGRLDWPPNRDGLNWFLGNVWPNLKRGELELMIAGSGDDSWVHPYRGLDGVRLLGCVDDISPLYAQCCAAVVPVFYGSGTRLKVIEPARFSRACISSAMGIEGSCLTGDEYIHAETAEDWIRVLDNLDCSELQKKGQAAHKRLKPIFEQEQVAQRFLDELKKVW